MMNNGEEGKKGEDGKAVIPVEDGTVRNVVTNLLTRFGMSRFWASFVSGVLAAGLVILGFHVSEDGNGKQADSVACHVG